MLTEFPEFDIIKYLKGGHTPVSLIGLTSGRLAVLKTIDGHESGFVQINGQALPNEVAAHLIVKPHRRVVEILSYDVIPASQTPDEPALYRIILEYCTGLDLDHLLEERGIEALQIPEAFIWQILKQFIEALDYLNQSGVEHQDVLPGNMFLRFNGPIVAQLPELVMADFGFIKFIAEGEAMPDYSEPIQEFTQSLYARITAEPGPGSVEPQATYSEALVNLLATLSASDGGTHRPFTLRYLIDNVYPNIDPYIQASGPAFLPEWMRNYFITSQANVLNTDEDTDTSSSWGDLDPEVGGGATARPEERVPGIGTRFIPDAIEDQDRDDLGLVIRNLTRFFIINWHNPELSGSLIHQPPLDLDDLPAVLDRLGQFSSELLKLLRGTHRRYQILRDATEFNSFVRLIDYVALCRLHADECRLRMQALEDSGYYYVLAQHTQLKDEFDLRLDQLRNNMQGAHADFEQNRTNDNLQRFLQTVDDSHHTQTRQIGINRRLRIFDRTRLEQNQVSLEQENRYMRQQLRLPEEGPLVTGIESWRFNIIFNVPEYWNPTPPEIREKRQRERMDGEISPRTNLPPGPPPQENPIIPYRFWTQDDEDRYITAFRNNPQNPMVTSPDPEEPQRFTELASHVTRIMREAEDGIHPGIQPNDLRIRQMAVESFYEQQLRDGRNQSEVIGSMTFNEALETKGESHARIWVRDAIQRIAQYPSLSPFPPRPPRQLQVKNQDPKPENGNENTTSSSSTAPPQGGG